MVPVVIVLGVVVYLSALRALRLLSVGDLEFIREFLPAKAHFIVKAVAKVAGVK
jgi:hypothetical protein